MSTNNKIVTTITEPESIPVLLKPHITDEQLKREYNYCMAQKILKSMLEKGLISADEFNKIMRKNRETFSPYLAEIMS